MAFSIGNQFRMAVLNGRAGRALNCRKRRSPAWAVPPRVAALAPFDVVLCSDCVFWEKLHRPLAQTLALLLLPLAGPEGKVHRFDPKFAS